MLVCPHCRVPIETGTDSWPGDTMVCPHCAKTIEAAKAGTYIVKKDTNIPELSPSPGEGTRPTMLETDQTLQPGALVGQYKVIGLVGKGGMGAVYRAVHTLLSRDVAIKVLPPDLAKDPEFVRRFKREAMALAKLQHPNIVAVHDMGVQGEIYYFVMEFVDGVNLRVLLHEKRLAPEQALAIVPKLCEALEYAHQRGIVHRDIKPENIMLDRGGEPKIADFGLAKILRGDSAIMGLTQTNVIMGTLDYMAPEQREATANVDHRADIFSLGVVLYEMLTGDIPIGHFDPPSRKVQVDVRLDDVVLKALEHDPDRRYQRATHFGGDVTHILTQAAPAAGAIAVIDQKSGKQIARSQKRALGIELESGRVAITSWAKEEVGLADPRGCEAVEERGIAILRFKGDGLLSVNVPRDLDVAVRSTSGDVVLNDASGRLTVNTSSGDVTLSRYKGGVTIQSTTGDVTVRDLVTGDFSIHLENGDVDLAELKFRAGDGSVSSKTGNIAIAPDPAFSSFTYDLTTTKGGIYADVGDVLESKPHHVFGRLRDGAGKLKVLAEHGSIRMGRSTTGAFHALPTPGAFWSRMPMSYRQQVGKYVITMIALFLFFCVLLTSPMVWGIIAIFWGMSLAIKGWNIYNALPPENAPNPVELAVKAATAIPAAMAAASAAPPTPPPSAKPRLPVFVVLANIAIIVGVLLALGSMIVHWVDLNAATVIPGDNLDETHIGSFVLTAMIAIFAGAGFLFAAAARMSVAEVPHQLRGRGGARFAMAVAVILIIYAALAPGQHLWETKRDARAAMDAVEKKLAGSGIRGMDLRMRHFNHDRASFKVLRPNPGPFLNSDPALTVDVVRSAEGWIVDDDSSKKIVDFSATR